MNGAEGITVVGTDLNRHVGQEVLDIKRYMQIEAAAEEMKRGIEYWKWQLALTCR